MHPHTGHHHHRLKGLRQERRRLELRSRIREIIFGVQDGLLVPLGVVTTVAGAFNNNHIVVVAGIAEGLAGAFSMATGAYLAYQAERGVRQAEVRRQRQLAEADPPAAQEELEALLERDGLDVHQAAAAASALATRPSALLGVLVPKKLGIEVDSGDTTVGAAAIMGASYLAGSVVPLWPYFWLSGRTAIAASMASTLVVLFLMGILKGAFGARDYLRSGLQVLIIGAVSGLGGYLLGGWLPRALHLL